MLNILGSFFENFIFLILYITNGATFPKPLTAAEELFYLERFKNGDKAAKDILIERNLRLVAHIIKKYHSGNKEQEDLISIGTIGLIKGVTSYKESKGTRLATYAAKCIENEILMYFRAQRKNQGEMLISDPIETDGEGNALTFMDIVYEDEDIADSIDLKLRTQELYSYLDCLTEREKKILTLRYGLYNTQPMTQKKVAKKLDISRSYVSRIEKRALENLRKCFERPSK